MKKLLPLTQIPDLNDNAQGFSNFTATGADRLKIRAYLTKRPIDGIKYENFIELMEVSNGEISAIRKDTEYNEIAKEFAKEHMMNLGIIM